MKHIKTYESDDFYSPVKIGEYVICKESPQFHDDEDKSLAKFLAINIGQVIEKPKEQGNFDKHQENFIWVKFDKKFTPDPDGFFENQIRPFFRNEITHHAPLKDDLEYLLAANKYNL